MAITRLNDFVTVAKDKWTYGDFKFNYEGAVNQDHNVIYPLMLMEPPTSVIPDVYEGFETYTVEFEFYNSYKKAAQDAVTLQRRWDNLQDLAMEWLDNILIHFSGGTITSPSTSSPTPTQVYINKDSLSIQRDKEEKNDRLVKITMSFDMRMFTRCFTNKSKYPNQVSNLNTWFRADSGVTHNVATRKTSIWSDYSGGGRDVEQSTSSKQPLRYGYDGANEKAYIDFNGTSHQLTQTIGEQAGIDLHLTAFAVYKFDKNTGVGFLISIDNLGTDTKSLQLGYRSDLYYLEATDSDGTSGFVSPSSPSSGSTAGYNIITIKANMSNGQIFIKSNNNNFVHTNIGSFASSNLENASITLGSDSANSNYFDGGVSEIIVYSRVLEDGEINNVLEYLNNKYRIY